MASSERQTFNEQIIEEARANKGRVENFPGMPVIILHTIGRTSGDTHLVPLILIINEDNDMLLFASAAGAMDHPSWALNLRANPNITVEVEGETFDVRVEELSGDELEQKTQTQMKLMKPFAKYVELAAPRTIPIFSLHRV